MKSRRKSPIFIEPNLFITVREGFVYEWRIGAVAKITDPKKFFSDRSRRKQDLSVFGDVAVKIRLDLLLFQTSHHKEIGYGVPEACFSDSMGTYRSTESPACLDFGKKAGEYLTKRYGDQGVEVNSHIEITQVREVVNDTHR